MNHRKRVSHARGVYLTQYNSSMGTARVKQEEETDARIMQDSSQESGRKESTEGKNPRQDHKSDKIN